MDAIKTLIDRYDLEGPVTGNDVGEFTNAALQELYHELVAAGSESLASALRVGAAIEDLDIVDLQEHIAETDAVDVEQVYENLMRGSRNHLRAFVSTLERQTGESYEPQHLSPTAYEEIISGTVETGAPSGQGKPGGRGGQRGRGTFEGHGGYDGRGGWGTSRGPGSTNGTFGGTI